MSTSLWNQFCSGETGKGWKNRNIGNSQIYGDINCRWIQQVDGSYLFYGNNGEWGSRRVDGSGVFYCKDGSVGEINIDGSIVFHYANGSVEYINVDGRGIYHGKDGSVEYINTSKQIIEYSDDYIVEQLSHNEPSYNTFIQNESYVYSNQITKRNPSPISIIALAISLYYSFSPIAIIIGIIDLFCFTKKNWKHGMSVVAIVIGATVGILRFALFFLRQYSNF